MVLDGSDDTVSKSLDLLSRDCVHQDMHLPMLSEEIVLSKTRMNGY